VLGGGWGVDMMDMRRALLMGEMIKSMELIGTYIVQESWENDTLGNALAVYNTVLKPYVDADNLGDKYNVYIALFATNTCDNYKYRADYMMYHGTGNYVGTNVMTIRYNRTNISSGAATNRSFWAGPGSKIEIYRLYNPTN
jgi:hypothetical protein